MPLWPSIKVGSYKGQRINGILTYVCLTVSSEVLQTQASECVIGIHIIINWQNLHLDSQTCEMRVITTGKTKWKPLELSSILG